MLNSTEHYIYPAHKCLSLKSRKKVFFSSILGYEQFKFHAQLKESSGPALNIDAAELAHNLTQELSGNANKTIYHPLNELSLSMNIIDQVFGSLEL